MNKKEKKIDITVEEPMHLDIPEDEIWTYQVEGLAAPRINKTPKHYNIKKVIFVVTIVLAVSLSCFFSILTLRKDTFEFEQVQNGYAFTRFSNTGYITELEIDYVADVEYELGNSDPKTNFKVVKDETKPVTEVGSYVLNCDEKVQTITIGAGVEKVDSKAFYSCWALREIRVDENNPNYCDVDGVLYNKDKTELICRPCDHDTYLAEKYGYARYDENGYRIEPYADDEYFEKRYFYAVTQNVQFSNIEQLVEYFEQEENGKVLEEFFAVGNNRIDFEEFFGIGNKSDEGTIEKIKRAVDYLFSESDEGLIQKIKNAVAIVFSKPEEKDKSNYFEYCEKYFNPYYERYTKDVLTYVIPSTVETVGELCFNYANMVDVYIPEGVKKIETLSFFEIPRLENIYSYKGENADTHFTSKKSLGEIYLSLPEGLEEIGSDAFSYNREMKYMYIPSSVKYIGHNAFWDTVYKDGKELKGIVKMNVAVSEEEFESTVETGNDWCPKYDYFLFKKNIDIVYSAERN